MWIEDQSKEMLALLTLFFAVGSAGGARDWTAVDAVLRSAIAAGVAPALAGGVLGPDGRVLYKKGFGSYVYAGQETPIGGDNPATTASSLFDMASITKILGATTSSALLVDLGLLDLDMAVADASLLGAAFAQNGKGSIRVRDCLLHQAGYPPDPTPSYADAVFGCPAAAPPPLTFSCSERIFASLLAQDLAYLPGTQWVYSDLSMITMQYVIGTIVASRALVTPAALLPSCASADPATQPGLYKTCHFEAFVRTRVFAAAAMPDSTFLPPAARWSSAVPTWNDTYYRNEMLQGVVSDENGYALGGIAGHAGVFSTLDDMLAFAGAWAGYAGGAYAALISNATRALFFAAPNSSFSPRALGWVTQAPTDTYLGCGNMSSATAYHTGYTGTLICIDPSTSLSLVLLTNRVYPNKTAEMDGVHATRQAFVNAVLAALAPPLA